MIRDKARTFAATTSSPDGHVATSASWIEKFKLKNNLMGARSRKGSLAPDDSETGSAAASNSHTPSGVSPTSPQALGSPSPIELHSAQSHESLKNESPDSYLDFAGAHRPFHSTSGTSLSSAFTDTAPSSFSPGPLSPTSPFFTPDSGTAPSPFVPQTARPLLPATGSSSNFHRPRSQTFPLLDQYMSPPPSSEPLTPKYMGITVLDSPMEEAPHPISGLDGTLQDAHLTSDRRVHTVSPAETMRPPPPPMLPTRNPAREMAGPMAPGNDNPSPEEARRALEVVVNFFQQQPSNALDLQESMTIGKLMEKLKLHQRRNS